MTTWLPPPPAATTEEHRRRWQPSTLKGLGGDASALSYLVVDEIVGGSVGLVLSGWPDADDKGRLRFGGRPRMLGADGAVLQRFLEEHRLPDGVAARPVRIGDAFAIRVRPDVLGEVSDELAAQTRLEPLLDPGAWIEPPVYDVTAEAREAAKAAFYAAVTPTLTPRQAAEFAGPAEDYAEGG